MSIKRFAVVLTWGLLGLTVALLWLASDQPAAAQPTEWTVCPAGPPTCDYAVIQDAVDAANIGDVVKVAAGIYTGINNYGGLAQVVYISKTITIRGGYLTPSFADPPDPETNSTTLDAQQQGRVIYITGEISSTIEGLRITAGNATGLGGAFWGWAGGGGIYVDTATAIVSNCQIFSNTASTTSNGTGGGLFFYNGDAVLSGNTIFSNTASTASNYSGDGGGLYLYHSNATLSANWVQANTASSGGSGNGGGIILRSSDAQLNDNTIISNVGSTADYGFGGGLFMRESNATLRDNGILSNTASTAAHGSGGGLAIEHYSDAIVSGNHVKGNSASIAGYGSGGGISIQNSSNVTLNGNWVEGNTGSTVGAGAGGGLSIDACDSTLVGNVVVGNTAGAATAGRGGGVSLNDSDSLLVGNLVKDNTACTNGVGEGGGLAAIGCEPTLISNTIISNIASLTNNGRGGGLWIYGFSFSKLVNNIIADNRAGGLGSGIYAYQSELQALHTTFARNKGGDGTAVHFRGFSIAMTNTILVSHTVGIYFDGNSAKLEATLWGTGTWGNDSDWAGPDTIITGTVNIWGDPAFVNPDAGDYHIGSGSAAIDAGVDAGITVDIDGEPRPINDGYDIGADERFFGPRLAVTKRANAIAVQPGEQLTYTIRLTNTGAMTLTATITDFLPSNVDPTGTLTWQRTLTDPGEVWTQTVVVTVDAGYTGLLTNVVQVVAEEGATGIYTNVVSVEEAVTGLTATNDGPTEFGGTTRLTATVIAGSNVSYIWAFGDGQSAVEAEVDHIYPAVGIYTAVVTASNNINQLVATTPVTITEVPIIGLVATNDSPTTLDDTTRLTATITAGSNVTYTWAFGDGDNGTGAVVMHTYPEAQVYTAVVTASNNVNQLVATTTVTVNEPGFFVYLPLVDKNH